MIDPRLSVIDERLGRIKKIIAVASGKGGVGKSLIASTLALILSEKGFRAGLMDLDFTNPSTHLILGAESAYPLEDKGVVPPKIRGVSYASISFFTGGKPSPLRGEDVTNAFIEILALTRWGGLDYLVIDTPPGMGDALLDLLRLIRRVGFLVVSTPSRLSLETIKKLIEILRGVQARVIGVVENMASGEMRSIRREVEELGETYLGSISFDPEVEEAIGKPDKLLRTRFAEDLRRVTDKLV